VRKSGTLARVVGAAAMTPRSVRRSGAGGWVDE
jgi:hypothetical protein